MKNNLLIILAVVALAGGAWVFLNREAANDIVTGSVTISDEVLANTQLFMARTALLQSTSINRSLFTNPRFTSLVSYTRPVEDQPVGRTNPFEPAPPSGF
jgi:hypothetical protein